MRHYPDDYFEDPTPDEIRDVEIYMRYVHQSFAVAPRIVEPKRVPKKRRVTIDDCAFLWACGIRADRDIASPPPQVSSTSTR